MPTFRTLALLTGLFTIAGNAATTSTLTTTITACMPRMSCGHTSTVTAPITATTTVTKVSCAAEQHCSTISTAVPSQHTASDLWNDQGSESQWTDAGTASADPWVEWTATSAAHSSVTTTEQWSELRSFATSKVVVDPTYPETSWSDWSSSTAVASTKSSSASGAWAAWGSSIGTPNDAAIPTVTAWSQPTATFSSLTQAGESVTNSEPWTQPLSTASTTISAYTGSAPRTDISGIFYISSIYAGVILVLNILRVF